MTPFERALVGELEGSHGDRVHVGDVHGATALHHYAGLNYGRRDVLGQLSSTRLQPQRFDGRVQYQGSRDQIRVGLDLLAHVICRRGPVHDGGARACPDEDAGRGFVFGTLEGGGRDDGTQHDQRSDQGGSPPLTDDRDVTQCGRHVIPAPEVWWIGKGTLIRQIP